MSFWTVEGQDKVNGSEERAHIGGFSLIPNDTTATAVIKNIEKKQFEGSPEIINVNWKIVDGPHNNKTLFQGIKINDPDKAKKARALNMLMRLFVLSQVPVPDEEPEKHHLLMITGKLIDIHIMTWEMGEGNDKRSGNWINAVYPPGSQDQTPAPQEDHNEAMGIYSQLGQGAAPAPIDPLDDELPF